MPIPTIDKDQSPVTGGLTVRAQHNPIGEAVTGLGDSIQRTSKVIASVGIDKQQQADRLKALDDVRWAGEAYDAEKLALANYLSEDKVKHAENVSTLVKEFAEQRLAQYTIDSAPSPRAYTLFKKNYSNWATDKTIQTIELGANNKIAGAANSVKKSTSAAVTSFRLMEDNFPGKGAGAESLIDSIASIKSTIDASFAEYDPKLAKALHEDLITQSVLAASTVDISLAKSILDSSKEIDEQTRATLMSHLSTASKAHVAQNRVTFETNVADHITQVKAGTAQGKVPLDSYLQHFPEDQAITRKAKDDHEIAVYQRGNMFLKQILPQSADNQRQILTKLGNKEHFKTKEDEDTYLFVKEAVNAAIALQERNAVAFLNEYNPVVKQANAAIPNVSDAAFPAKIDAYQNTVLKYQGAAPEGVDTKEASLYLNKAQNDWHLLDANEAKTKGSKMNIAKPKEFMKETAELMALYPDENKQSIVFNDLVTLGGLNQQYQLAWLNKDEWWIDTYLGAIAGGKDVQVDNETKVSLQTRLESLETWNKFRQSMIGDNKQRANEIAGFKSGILQFAGSRVLDGKSESDAIEEATNRLLKSQLGFTLNNEHPLMVTKSRGAGKTPRTDEDVEEVGRKLTFVPQYLPAGEIDLTPFTGLFALNASPDKQQEAIVNHLSARGFWQTLPNGQGASLYAIDENGLQQFQVKDKQGNPFIVYFDDMPAFAKTFETSITGIPGAQTRTIVGVPGHKTTFSGSEGARYPGLGPNNKKERPSWLKTK